MSGKGSGVNTGDLPGLEVARHPAGVRAVIVVLKPGNSGGAKGGREWNHARKDDPSEQCQHCPQGLKGHGEGASGRKSRGMVCRGMRRLEWLARGRTGKRRADIR